MYERDYVRQDTSTWRAPWSPAQIVALALGVIYLAIGGVALARTGLDLGALFSHTDVAGLHHTMLMGFLTLLFGLSLIFAGAVPGADRFGMVFLGVVALGFGLVVAIEPMAFHRSLGMHEENGWVYMLTGLVVLAAAMLAPVVWSGRDRGVVDEYGEAPARRRRRVIVDE